MTPAAIAAPRVAIVVRTKDRPQLLCRALLNIDEQTFPDYSVVVVNDAGDPAAVDAVVAAAPPQTRDRTTVLHRAESAGMEAAANAGLRASSSEFCCIHDDDDLWEPRFLERTVAFLDARPQTEMVVVRIFIRYEEVIDGEYVETGRQEFWTDLPAITVQHLLITNRMVPIGVIYRRRLHDDVGFYDESLPVVGDWEFNLRVAARHEIGILDEALALWCQRPGATGASANSVLAAQQLHEQYDLKVRADAIREDLVAGGSMGPYLYQAYLMQEVFRHVDLWGERLTHQLVQQVDAQGERLEQEINRRADGLGHEQSELFGRAFDQMHGRLDRLERLLANRTNPLYLAKRGFDKVFRGRTEVE